MYRLVVYIPRKYIPSRGIYSLEKARTLSRNVDETVEFQQIFTEGEHQGQRGKTLCTEVTPVSEEKKKATKYVVSAQTGEVLNELYRGDRILRKESLDKLGEQDEMRYSDFVILNISEFKVLSEVLDIYEMGVVAKIIPYVSYITGTIQHRNGKKIGTEGIAEIVGLSRNKTYTVLTALVVKGVICKQREGREVYYCFNPYILHRGKFVSRETKEKFKPLPRKTV